MPAAERILTNNVIEDSMKQDILRSPRPKRLKHGKQKGSRTSKTLGQPKLNVLSKPEEDVINGKNRHRFPDPSHDKCILLGIFDHEETLIKLHYIDNTGIVMDEIVEKEIMNNPHGIHYFLKLEQVQRDTPTGSSEIETNFISKNIICAKLNDHTVSDTSVPKEVAGFWIRLFGQRSVFTMNFTLWSAEVNESNNAYFPFKGSGVSSEGFYNLEKLDEIHVQFRNKERKGQKQNRGNRKQSPSIESHFDRKELTNIIKKVRYLRDNGKVEEFNAKCSEILKSAKKNGGIDEELTMVLEESMCLCYQGNPSEGKRLLQKAVHMSSKSSNSNAIKNRAYLFLSFIHLNDGSFGTAQECLGMVGKEMDHLLSIEDRVLRSTINGIIMTNFGQKLSEMSQNLWHEATENFENALDLAMMHKGGTINDDSICMIHLWMTKLYLAMLKSSCSPGCKMPDIENRIIEHLNFFDEIESVKLSRRTTVFGLLMKVEYCMFLLQNGKAVSIIENIKELIAIDSKLYCTEMKILERIQNEDVPSKKTDDDVVMAMLAKTRDLLAKSDSDTGYSGDESSSNEIDLEAARYKQTTYV